MFTRGGKAVLRGKSVVHTRDDKVLISDANRNCVRDTVSLTCLLYTSDAADE